MHADKKVALGLGILVVGIVGALFFRNDLDDIPAAPRLRNAEQLDERIAENVVVPYLEPRANAENSDEATQEGVGEHWRLPDFLVRESTATPSGPVPDPIPLPHDADPIRPFAVKQAADSVSRFELPDSADRFGETHAIDPHRQVEQFELYKVQSGDTLSGIAEAFLGSSARYRAIFEANREVLPSPHDLRPGVHIRIPTIKPTPPAAKPTGQPVSTRRSQGDRSTLPPDGGSNRPVLRSGPDGEPNTPVGTSSGIRGASNLLSFAARLVR